MKKGLIALFIAGSFSAITLVSCGEKFTPLSEEQITAKVDSSFTAVAETKRAELKATCESEKEAKVAAKVAELEAAAAPAQ